MFLNSQERFPIQASTFSTPTVAPKGGPIARVSALRAGGYGRSLGRYASVRVDAAWRNNVEGLAGASDAALRMAVQARF